MLVQPRFDNPMPPPEPRGERAARRAAKARISEITSPLYAEFAAQMERLLRGAGHESLIPAVMQMIETQHRAVVDAAVTRHWPKFDFEARERVELAAVAEREAEDEEAWARLLEIADQEIEKVKSHV